MRFFAALFSMFLAFVAQTSFAFDQEHKAWDGLLKKYLDAKGDVAYDKWKNDTTALDGYLKTLEAVGKDEFEKWSVAEQKAFLINAYNAFTIKLIVKNFPLKSIKDLGGLFSKPWAIEFFSLLNGDIKSLDPIEHEYLRKKEAYKDPRVHAAVNCASVSCPRLRGEAFVARRLDEQLTDATKTWLADETRNEFDPKGKKIRISKIFDWFEEDFGGNDAGVIAFLKTYGPETARSLSGDIDIDYLDYNWDLNDQ